MPLPILMVCDANTYAVLGKKIESEFLSGELKVHFFESSPFASFELATEVQKAAEGMASLLAVGSGTINDLCKYAAHQRSLRYAIAITAPSMNGFISPNASLSKQGGLKQSYAATPPVTVVADIEILVAAPPRLIRAGLGDSLARPTAQVDWLLSYLLLDTPYMDEPFMMLKPFEKQLFDSSDKLLQGDFEAMELLFCTLLASGEGMRLAGGSHPASQGEHMIAHTMELLYGGTPAYHGEQIGVTTLTMARLQERLLAEESIILRPLREDHDPSFTKHSPEAREQATKRLAQDWDFIRTQIRASSLPASYLEEVLQRAGAPTTPEALGWKQEQYGNAIQQAAGMRDRFTFLDLSF